MNKLRRRRIPALRRTIGFVFQDFRLIPSMTVYENVAFVLRVIDAPTKYIRKRVPYVIGLVGLQDKTNAYPDELSGGEKQRVAIARALVNDPQLIIADEPTGNIDPELSYEIVELLQGINDIGTTILMVTHEHSLVRQFGGRIINIDQGQIVFDEVIGGNLSMKVSGFKYLVGQGVENIWKNRMMAFASFCVLLVSLLLVGMSVLFYMNLTSMIGGVEDKNEVIIYMDEGTTDQQLADFQSELSQIKNISSITFYSKEQAFEDLKNSMSDYEVLFDSLGDDNPLIDGYRIRIDDISQISTTITQIEQLDHIYSIRAPMDFVNVLTEVRKIVTVVFGVIIAALIVISVVIVSNATKASVFARREEIQIMKYVGATNAFIRIPFFVEGMITGLFAGAVALAITWFGYDSLVGLLTGQVDFLSVIGMGSIIPFRALAWKVALAYLVTGTLFGAFGSMISMRKHLNV